VARVGAADADAADRHRLAGPRVLVGEGGRGVGLAEVVARDAVVREADRGAGAAVVDLADARGADGQRPRGDVGAGAGAGARQRVVARVGAADADAADADPLAGPRVLVREGGAAVGVAEVVARHAVVRQAHAGVHGAVVDLALAGGADGQRPRGDVGAGAGAGALQRVVARVGAADADAADPHRLAGPRVLVREGGAAVGVAEVGAR